MDERQCNLLAGFFSLFANRTRMRIFCLLSHGPMTVTQIAEQADITVQNTSQHLRLMRDKGAVATHRQGHHVYYHTLDDRFYQAAQLIRDALADQWADKAAIHQNDS